MTITHACDDLYTSFDETCRDTLRGGGGRGCGVVQCGMSEVAEEIWRQAV